MYRPTIILCELVLYMINSFQKIIYIYIYGMKAKVRPSHLSSRTIFWHIIINCILHIYIYINRKRKYLILNAVFFRVSTYIKPYVIMNIYTKILLLNIQINLSNPIRV